MLRGLYKRFENIWTKKVWRIKKQIWKTWELGWARRRKEETWPHNKAPKPGWRNRPKFIVSQFWRPDVWNQGAGRAVLLLTALGQDSSGFFCFPVLDGNPCHSLASRCVTPVRRLSSFRVVIPLCMSGASKCSPFCKDTGHAGLGIILTYNLGLSF